MLALAIAIIMVPAIEMRCPLFSRCEQEHEFFPGWSQIFKKAPFNTPSPPPSSPPPPPPPDSSIVFKDFVGLIPKKIPTPGELEDFCQGSSGYLPQLPIYHPSEKWRIFEEGPMSIHMHGDWIWRLQFSACGGLGQCH